MRVLNPRNAGYSIGNENVSGGNHFFLLELGYNFE